MHNILSCKLLLASVVAGGLLALAFAPGSPVRAAPAPRLTLEGSLKKAAVDGKYRMLLRQFKVERDADQYGEFQDLGFRDKTEYAGHTDLPKGFWVYVQPYWYIWRDLSSVTAQRPKRAWGPEQATGEPDTDASGDIQTAWASQSQDDQDEWLLLEYEEPIVPAAILVHETYNPGALFRITVFKLDGEEVEVWKGKDPTPVDSGKGVSEIPVKVDFKIARVKLFIDSKNVPGWNEVDAVGVRDKARKMHWAVNADASSTYAQPFPAEKDIAVPADDSRLRRLEREVRELKKTVEELKKQLDKKDK